jgi:hypothetical protein
MTLLAESLGAESLPVFNIEWSKFDGDLKLAPFLMGAIVAVKLPHGRGGMEWYQGQISAFVPGRGLPMIQVTWPTSPVATSDFDLLKKPPERQWKIHRPAWELAAEFASALLHGNEPSPLVAAFEAVLARCEPVHGKVSRFSLAADDDGAKEGSSSSFSPRGVKRGRKADESSALEKETKKKPRSEQ